MVSSSSMVQFNGVVSGLNTQSVVATLMSLNQAPLKQLQAQQSKVQARSTAMQKVREQLEAVQTALKSLLTTTVGNTKTVASSTPAIATATTTSDAPNTTLTLNVTRLATATSVSSASAVSRGVDPGSAISASGFSLPPTPGTFTVNRVKIVLDPTDTLSDVLRKITDSSAGGSGNGTGVVASLVPDANGEPNFIQLTPIASKSGAIQLGAASDTSNFLAAADLVASGVSGGGDGAAIRSGRPLSTTSTSSSLSSVRFQSGAIASSGTLMINNTPIAWSSSDSLTTLMSRINSSSANVRAAYDPIADRVTLTQLTTGNHAIDLDETTSGDGVGVLQALGLSADNEQYGQTAQFSITQNGVTGSTQYSNSNSLTNISPGVSANLVATGSTTLTVSQDTQTITANVQAFIDQYNKLMDLVEKDTAYNPANRTAGVLLGDASIRSMTDQLHRLLSVSAPGVSGAYTTLASIGISTGKPGAAVGTTTRLQLDSARLTSALQNNPDAVAAVLGGSRTATLNPDSRGVGHAGSWISRIDGIPAGVHSGTYSLSIDSSGSVVSVYKQTGEKAQSPVTATLAAGESTSTLVPGLNVTAGTLPSAGVLTDTISIGGSGVLGQLNDCMTGLLGGAGPFKTQSDLASRAVADLNKQIDQKNTQLGRQQQTLQSQFTAMEAALARVQGQGTSLLSSLVGRSTGNAS